MTTDLHTLSGAYAVDALSAEEAAEFSRHLEECPACRDEVRELQEAASRMGASEALVAPAALRARVLAAADRQSQLPPVVTPLEQARSRRRVRVALGAVAAAAVLAVGTVIGVGLQGDDAPPNIEAGSVAQVFDAADAQTTAVRTADGKMLRVALSRDSGQMAIATSTLRKLTAEQVYQLWAVHNGKATSVGLVKDQTAGQVVAIPAEGSTVAITVEPSGGSRRPTGKKVAEVDPAVV